jgi:hypothetical protein
MSHGQLYLYIGFVTAVDAYTNSYYVDIFGNQAGVHATMAGSGGGRRIGHLGGSPQLPGSYVVVAVQQQLHEGHTGYDIPAIILANFEPWPTGVVATGEEEKTPDFFPANFNPDVPDNQLLHELHNTDTLNLLGSSREVGHLLEATPGDWYKLSPFGGAFYLSNFMARIAASHACYIDLRYLEDAIEFCGRNQIVDAEAYLREILQRGSDVLIREGVAFDIFEGMGVKSSTPFLQSAGLENDPTRLEPRDPAQAAFFRQLLLQGGQVEGSWQTYKADSQDRTIYTYGANTYPGMLSVMQRLDGVYRLRASREIKFEKTFDILVPELTKELRTASRPDPDPKAAEPESVEEHFGLSEEEYRALYPLIHSNAAAYEERNLFFAGLRKEGDLWFFPEQSDIVAEVFEAGPPTLPMLGRLQQEYTLEDVAQALLEVYPGKQVKLFKNSSVFLMSDDGGFTIGDGWGASIRANRGKLILEAAGDIEMRPGRDLVEFTPGNRIIKAGDRVEITSSRDSIALKAEKNLHALSGNSGEGSLILENKADVPLHTATEQFLNEGEAIGSGIILKAASSGVALLGSYIYGGGVSPGTSRNGIDRDQAACNIYLEGGRSGSVLISGGSGSFLFDNSVAMGMLDSVVGYYVNGSNLYNIAEGSNIMVAPAGVVLDSGSGSIRLPRFSPSGVREIRRPMPTVPTPLLVQGEALFKTNVLIGGNTSVAGGVTSNDGANSQPRIINRFSFDLPSQSDSIGEALQTVHAASFGLLSALATTQGVATAFGHQIAGFAFPATESRIYRAAEFTVVAPRWQLLLDSSSTWLERAVTHGIVGETFPYPGKAKYEENDALVSVDENGEKTTNSLSDYRVNLETGD